MCNYAHGAHDLHQPSGPINTYMGAPSFAATPDMYGGFPQQ
jgi:hypothetical protein